MTDFIDSHGNIVPLPPDQPVQWRVSGYALVTNQQGQYLMVQSGDRRWHFPGGGVEMTESIPQAIVRECLEETGYTVAITDKTTPYYLREQSFYHSGEQAFYHSIQLFYKAKLTSSLSDKSKIAHHDSSRQQQWLVLADIPSEQLHPSIALLASNMLVVT